MQTQGREIGEIKKELKDVSKTVTEMSTILPHLVTKEHCAEARSDTVRKMKDRMDGKREITGVNMTLPELWEKAAKVASQDKPHPRVPPPERGAVYFIKLTAAIVSLIGVLLGMTTFVVKTMQRQEETDRILRSLEQNTRHKQVPAPAPAQPPQLQPPQLTPVAQ
jgi:hypothetical protein